MFQYLFIRKKLWKKNLLIDDSPQSYESFKTFWGFDFRDPKDLFLSILHYLPGYWGGPEERFDIPKHFIFANIVCLRCGLCCKNYEGADIVGDLEKKLIEDGKKNLLDYIYLVGRDEFKIGSGLQTADWFKTEYANTSDPDTFYTITDPNEPSPPVGSAWQIFGDEGLVV